MGKKKLILGIVFLYLICMIGCNGGVNVSDLPAKLSSLDPKGGPYTIKIADQSPVLADIKNALTANKDVKVNLDLSRCTGVTSIGNNSLSGCNALMSIIIPNTVKSIGVTAFNGCGNLASVSIPDSVTNISLSAFWRCSGLTSVKIPKNVNYVGGSAFCHCNSLISIIVDENNTKYDSRNNCNAIIETAKNTLVVGCKSTVIPDNIAGIGEYAFRGCIGLTNVIIPNGVKNIDKEAFRDCNKMTALTVKAATPPTVGSKALSGCSALKTIYVPEDAVDAYKAADGWSDLADKIIAIQ